MDYRTGGEINPPRDFTLAEDIVFGVIVIAIPLIVLILPAIFAYDAAVGRLSRWTVDPDAPESMRDRA
jgi:hypothetical protein